MNKEKKIKILFAEDSELDMELALVELVKNGIDFIYRRVDCEKDFRASMPDFEPDIVISDYFMSAFEGIEALKISKKMRPFIPFIIVTGALNEEIAVECIKAGATDYVIKDRIARLPFALMDALRHRDMLLKKAAAEKALIQSEESYRNLFENNNAVMLIVDPVKLLITDANPSAMEFYGYSRKSFVGKKITDISRLSKEDILKRFKESESGVRSNYSSIHVTAEGLEKEVNLFISHVIYRGESLIHLIIQDVSDRNRALEELGKALNEKTALINEIFHRTKNTLQVLISIMGIKSFFINDDNTISLFGGLENRIRAISLAHEGFYKTGSFSRIKLNEYIDELSRLLIKRRRSQDCGIELLMDLAECEVLIDTAIPIGLAFYEVMDNALTHAFKGRSEGVIKVSLAVEEDNCFYLTVGDNGAGLPQGLDPLNCGTSGFQLLYNIIEYQLKGDVVIEEKDGFNIILKFRDFLHRERI